MKESLKRTIIYGIAAILLACVAMLLICDMVVVSNARGKTFSEIDSIKYNKVGTTSSYTELMLQSSCIRLEK